MKISLSLILVIILTGCATPGLGPVNSPYFSTHINNIIPENDGKAKLSGAGIWLPNTKGFIDIEKTANAIPGVILLTDKALFVSQWSEKDNEYQILKRFELSTLKNVTIDDFGLSNRVTIQWKDYSNDAFTLTSPSGGFMDSDKTLAFYALLKE